MIDGTETKQEWYEKRRVGKLVDHDQGSSFLYFSPEKITDTAREALQHRAEIGSLPQRKYLHIGSFEPQSLDHLSVVEISPGDLVQTSVDDEDDVHEQASTS
jgi:hypothetical protein